MADTSIYSRLKKLFSTGTIVRNIGGKQLKVIDADNLQSTLTNAQRDRFSRVYTSGYGGQGAGQYGTSMAYQAQRLTLFRDYDMMDNDPIIASALDIYADESTVKNEYGEILTIHTDNSRVKEVLHNLFYDIMNIEFTLWSWVRNMSKYGDFFLFLEISPEYGIVNVMPLSHYDTIRIEGENPDNPQEVKFETMGANGIKSKFDNYEVAHFRLVGDMNFMPYGKSMIENARRIFRQLTLMEDAMMIHRIMRAPEKRVFKIDIGNIPPGEVDAYIQSVIDKSKKVPFVDPATGDYNLRYNMQNILEDFYLPVRGSDSGTSIENLQGLVYESIDDIEYLRNKEMAALKIPKAFLGYDEQVNGKATLAAEDVRFARTIERIQRILVSELTKIAVIHLYSQGFRDEELLNFSLSLTNPSTIAEQEKINLWTQQVGLVAQMQGTKLMSSEWMYENIFKMSKDEIEKERARLVADQKRAFRLTQIEQGQPDPMKFGFPQDQPTPQGQPGDPNSPGGPPGAPSSEMPPAGPPGAPPSTAGGAPPGGMPQSLDDLPTAEELGLEEDTETRGRPKTGSVYGQDSHVRGRDPLGFKERYNAMQVRAKRKGAPTAALSLETMMAIDSMIAKTAKLLKEETIIHPTDDEPNETGTYLDERNILENDGEAK
jgi:hypothetical protein